MREAAGAVLGPSVRRLGLARDLLPQLGPAFVTAIAFVDPGNFATNVTAGSRFGYRLIWVVMVSNLLAMLIQYLSAKLGIATGRSLSALCRDAYPRPVSHLLWVQAEVVAIATDLAEIVGGAVALRLLFGLPLVLGGFVTGAVAFALLGLRRRGERPFEVAVIGLLGVILVGFAVDLVISGMSLRGILDGAVPRLAGVDSAVLAVGMLGATVMPHAIFLHGGLTSARRYAPIDPPALMRAQQVDVVLAMCLAGVMNLLLVVIGAAALSGQGLQSLDEVHAGLGRALGSGAALFFALALLASGLAASSVGTLSGQLVMEGFLRRRVPDALRRLVTLTPALALIALGVDPTRALVASQVVLSLGIPFALVPLVHLTARREFMGPFTNRRRTTVLGCLFALVVVGINVTVIVGTVG